LETPENRGNENSCANVIRVKLTVTKPIRQMDRSAIHVRADTGDSSSVGRSEPPTTVVSTAELLGPGAVAAARWRRRPDDRLKRAVRRVLIALSFKSNKGQSRTTERGTKQQLQPQHQQQSLQLSSWQLIPGTTVPPANYWDPVCHHSLLSYQSLVKHHHHSC